MATETVSTASLAVYEILRAFKVPCDFMVGHSAGEHVALRAAGMAKFESRNHLKQELQRLNQVYQDLEASQAVPTGVLLSVAAVPEQVVAALFSTYPDSCYLVADNCPSQVLVFVKLEHQSAVIEFIKAAGGICTPLPFDRAYHTPLFRQGSQALRDYYKDFEPGSYTIPVYSCATAAPYPSDPEAIRDLLAEQWSLPVRFQETVDNLFKEGVRTFIEVGANSNLTNFVENILRGRDCTILPTDTTRRSSLAQLLWVIGRLWGQGADLDLSPLYQYRSTTPVNWQQRVPPPPPRTSRQLTMQLPHLKLPPSLTTAVLPDSNQPSLPAKETATPEMPAALPSIPAVPLSEPPHGSSPPLLALQTVSSSMPMPPANGQVRQTLVEAHQNLMQAFLINQTRVSSLVFQQFQQFQPQHPPAGGPD